MALTVDSTKTWSADDNMNSTFHFFALPRELRDHVYEKILDEPVEIKQSACEMLRVRARGVPTGKLQRVSKQFKHEILGKAARRCCVELRDHDEYASQGFELPLCFRSNILHAEIHLELDCDGVSTHDCDMLHEIQLHQEHVIKPLAELCNLQSVDIKLCLERLAHGERCKRTLLREQLQIVDSIPVSSEGTSIEVYEYNHFVSDPEERLVMKFDPATREIKLLE